MSIIVWHYIVDHLSLFIPMFISGVAGVFSILMLSCALAVSILSSTRSRWLLYLPFWVVVSLALSIAIIVITILITMYVASMSGVR